ncbi:hypothetical protein CAPI_02865 [Corynebacterium capitovis DSM 44611]|nr:hypothetical protein [Corynebacterium capitovis]WKD57138.1 hypothetical protein CAPI_02865 [Corynebacterium capitovis DSM 44611]
MTSPDNELNRLLDASVHRIGNESGNPESFDDIEDTVDSDAPEEPNA